MFWAINTTQHQIPGGSNSCNVVIGAVLPWRLRSFVYSYSCSLGSVLWGTWLL